MADLVMAGESSARKKTRPKLVWVITIFYVLAAGYTLLSFALIYGEFIPINEAQQTYFSSQNLFDISLTIAIGALNLVGAISLFLLRKLAYRILLSAFVISMILSVYQTIFKNWIDAMGGSTGLVGVAIGFGINISIILYVKYLTKKKVLK